MIYVDYCQATLALL